MLRSISKEQVAEGLELVEAASVIWHHRIICHIKNCFVTFVTCVISANDSHLSKFERKSTNSTSRPKGIRNGRGSCLQISFNCNDGGTILKSRLRSRGTIRKRI